MTVNGLFNIIMVIALIAGYFIMYSIGYKNGNEWHDFKREIPRFEGFYDIKVDSVTSLIPEVRKAYRWRGGMFEHNTREIISWRESK